MWALYQVRFLTGYVKPKTFTIDGITYFPPEHSFHLPIFELKEDYECESDYCDSDHPGPVTIRLSKPMTPKEVMIWLRHGALLEMK